MFAYTLNPFVRVGLIAIEIGGVATYYAESLHDAEQLAQLLQLHPLPEPTIDDRSQAQIDEQQTT